MAEVERRQASDRRTDDPQPDWISISRYARRYGIDRATVYKWLDAKLLKTYQMGRIIRIRNLAPDEHKALLDVDAR